MNRTLRVAVVGAGMLGIVWLEGVAAQVVIPEPLRAWREWVLWGEKGRENPPLYSDASKRPGLWLSRLELDLTGEGGRFRAAATVFEAEWVPLPGSTEAWPQGVTANGAAVPVVERGGRPVVRLGKGSWRLEGRFVWPELPPRLQLPPPVGVLALTVGGRPVPGATWDGRGTLMLRATRGGEAEKDFLSKQVYRALEDGIPMWLRTEVELTVSGKSREEDLGNALPEGWTLAQVNSPLPVAVDGEGNVRAQVRAGRWTIKLDAFRVTSAEVFGYGAGVVPMVPVELVAFRAKPEFRLLEVVGIPAVDVSQTTMPTVWRDLPVYQWETARPFRLEERMRGMGLQRPEGLRVERRLWLDEDGRAFTFQDRVTGERQEIWRLDAAAGQELGSVRMDGEGQLITRNPVTGASGVEIRTRNLNLEATGRAARAGSVPASGWRADADQVKVDVVLPPGWRLLAVFGSDWVRGDWLTAWTLLDLFVLLVFAVAVWKLWGPVAGLLALVAFGLSYHEPNAPRYAWLFLLVPLALARVVPKGWPRMWVRVWQWVAVGILIVVAAPFVVEQVTAGLYPQLERRGMVWDEPWSSSLENAIVLNEGVANRTDEPGAEQTATRRMAQAPTAYPSKPSGKKWEMNMAQRAEARIQTGPGVPEWTWRTVGFGWNGPVTAEQEVRPVLVPAGVGRVLCFVRVVLLLWLAGVLLGLDRKRLAGWLVPARGAAALAMVCFLVMGWPGAASAQFPSQELLEQMKARLLQVPEAFPNAATIPQAMIQLREDRLVVEAEVHAAAMCAVPLPGRLPSWSPVSVQVAGRPEAALRREDGFLWVVVPEGVSRVRVEGSVAGATEWECAFRLKPFRVTVDAPGWAVNGIKPTGEPEAQVFFSRQGQRASGEATFDQRDYAAVVSVDRTLEIGLVWKVRTEVRRLSAPGKAVSLRVPLLPGENVLSSNLMVRDGLAEVRLGAQEQAMGWESELAQSGVIALRTAAEDAWVERWTLMLSPVWSVELKGLPPMFEPGNPALVPVWQPWPGEGVELEIGRPEAVEGATLTVQRARLETEVGRRQRSSSLKLGLQCSVGQDVAVGMPEGAEISSLSINQQSLPARMDGGRVVVPVRPGESEVILAWKENRDLGVVLRGDRVTLPVVSANVTVNLRVPQDRWILWAGGPLQGPAVRFWVIVVCAALVAYLLGGRPLSPIKGWEWMLLALGLTQVSLAAAAVVVGWFFLFAWRGRSGWKSWPGWCFNLGQVVLVVVTVTMLGVVLVVVGAGLLGSPEMYIAGNGSTRTSLNWFAPRTGTTLPEPTVVSVSVWWYRLLMLAWALWLAFSLIRWLKWAFVQFGIGGWSRPWSADQDGGLKPPPGPVEPPPLPTMPKS